MGAQDIVFYIGIAAFVVAAVFAALAIRTFFAEDIRGVMADLSGQARRGARNTAVGDRAHTRRMQRRRTQDDAGLPGQDMGSQAPPVVNTTSEDGIDTILDTSLKEAGRSTMGISNDNKDINDDMPTLVTSIAEYSQGSDAVSSGDSEAPMFVEGGASVSQGTFRLTRSIVSISSNEVISVVD